MVTNVENFFLYKVLKIRSFLAQKSLLPFNKPFYFNPQTFYFIDTFALDKYGGTSDEYFSENTFLKKVFRFPDSFSENKINLIFKVFFKKNLENKVNFILLPRPETVVFDSYSFSDNFFSQIDQGSSNSTNLITGLFDFNEQLKILELKHLNRFFLSTFSDSFDAFLANTTPLYFFCDEFFPPKSLFEDIIPIPICSIERVDFKAQRKKFLGKLAYGWKISLFGGLKLTKMYIFNLKGELYKNIFFSPKELEYKGYKGEMPFLLQIDTTDPITYTKASKIFKNGPSGKPFLVIKDNFLANLFYESSPISAGVFWHFFQWRKNIWGLTHGYEWLSLYQRWKNRRLFFKALKYNIYPFNTFAERSYRPAGAPEVEGYGWSKDFIKVGTENIFFDLKKFPSTLFSPDLYTDFGFKVFNEKNSIKFHSWSLIEAVVSGIYYLKLKIFLAKVSKYIYIFKLKQYLGIWYGKSFPEFHVLFHLWTSSLESRIYFQKRIGYKNVIYGKIFYFFKNPPKNDELLKYNYKKFHHRFFPFLKKKFFFQNSNFVNRSGSRNWMPIDQAFLRLRSVSPKFYGETVRLTPKTIRYALFKELETQRIYKKIESLNGYYNLQREGLAQNYNYLYATAKFSSKIIVSIEESFKKYNPSLPFRKKKKTLFFIQESWQEEVSAKSAALVNSKLSIKFITGKIGLPFFGVNFSSFMLPFYRGFPTYGLVKLPAPPATASLIKASASFILDMLFKRMLCIGGFFNIFTLIKADPSFYKSRYLFSPRRFTWYNHYLNKYLYLEDTVSPAVQVNAFHDSLNFFRKFKNNEIVEFTFNKKSFSGFSLEKNSSFYYSMFTPQSEWKISYNVFFKGEVLRKQRGYFFWRKAKKNLIFINEVGFCPDYTNLFKKHSFGYSTLNPFHKVWKYRRNPKDLRTFYWSNTYLQMLEGYSSIMDTLEEEEENIFETEEPLDATLSDS